MRMDLPPGANKADIQVITADTVDKFWEKPFDAQLVHVICIGRGGAGGSGQVSGPGVVAKAGGGGGGGAYSESTFLGSQLPDKCYIECPAPKAGGAGVTSGNGLSGFGSSDLPTAFRRYENDVAGEYLVWASEGLSGPGGNVTPPLPPTAAFHRGGGQFTSADAGTADSTGFGGNPGSVWDVNVAAYTSAASSGVGGAGGGVRADDVASRGGYGGAVAMLNPWGMGTPGLVLAPSTAVGSGNSGVNAFPSINRPHGIPGPGGSGGGGSIDSNGGNGAAGGEWGGGGGGGGGARTGFTSGAGGNGGPGICVVITYF